ncbi:hypothetical protein [Natrarchaeobius oligotrophus]|uniref:Twin-arginine translocation signal domain-containing protein n=1 Tax=Natrarchaeobius chitinivorans TaxID=1679083 RepID=A0A3N6NP89_NATCH|nr:hypothetical protein [Natrarchaeobius chitinivorans]RQH01473.1 hypothetical protein EA472_08550 [Natrarchaeobius chitinivorans]
MDDDSPYTIDRRSVLKAASTSAATLGIASGMASASDDDVSLAEYEAADRIRRVLDEEADQLLEELEAEGYVDSDSLPSLQPTEGNVSRYGRSGTQVQRAEVDGETVPRIALVTESDAYTTELHVYPEAGGTRALVEPTDESDGSLEVFTVDGDEVTASDCWTLDDPYCDMDGCPTPEVELFEIVMCIGGSCMQGSRIGCEVLTTSCHESLPC